MWQKERWDQEKWMMTGVMAGQRRRHEEGSKEKEKQENMKEETDVKKEEKEQVRENTRDGSESE